MRRREFTTLLAAAAAWPLAARAQKPAIPVIGVLGATIPDDAEVARNLAAFRQGLADTGFVEGQNVRIEYRWAEGRNERLPALAAELVNAKVDVIANEGGRPTALAAKNATSTIPIVFHTGFDPVADGLIESLARPGGNLTGVSVLTIDLSPKHLQLVSEFVPQARTIALLVNPSSSNAETVLREVVANSRDKQLNVLKASSEAEIDSAFAGLSKSPAGAIIIGGDTFFTTRRDQIVALAARYAIPAIYSQGLFSRSGGLISYGPSLPAAYRLKGNYVGKILSGAKPADLPVQQPTTFELVINLKTAKALGLDIPPALLARADDVIE
jgi:putative tryptophan/tyrosine transport system substrate-binding protein